MHGTWQNCVNAPQVGATICSSKLIEEGTAHCLEAIFNDKLLPVIVIRIEGEIYCYVNTCPHQHLPLNYRSENIISSDKRSLLCSAHGASFDIKTGKCLTGFFDKIDIIAVFEDQKGNLRFGHRDSQLNYEKP
ncbi:MULTISPECIES: Rieske 2Fe-2S domain-containing protein [unclassified Halomonas]|uniref:Rieske (2Fe-2S) protein n=1 Tax=unclassified Halomonas TaxID=2609666 RepID=UPI0020766EE6|nr:MULTISPECIES: Rieske 2Fe-2S domain-containing protein [unclassified Halomonas]